MADKILGRIQVNGQWFKSGDEAKLKKSKATKDQIARWRVEGMVTGFTTAGAGTKPKGEEN